MKISTLEIVLFYIAIALIIVTWRIDTKQAKVQRAEIINEIKNY